MTRFLNSLKEFHISYKLRLLAALVAVLSLIGAYHAGKAVGAAEERGTVATEQVAATTKGVHDGGVIEQDVISLPDTDLDRRYAKWLRD